MIYLALGSNLAGDYPDCITLLRAALTEMPRHRIRPLKCSSFYKSKPIGVYNQPDFTNAVVQVETLLSPQALLAACHELERIFGRARCKKWGARTLDIDLLDYHGQLNAYKPQIPHPRLQDRAFVLAPLAQIAPAWRHPLSRQSVLGLLSGLPLHSRAACRLFA